MFKDLYIYTIQIHLKSEDVWYYPILNPTRLLFNIYRRIFLGNLIAFPKKSLLRRHFFPPIAPISPWADDSVARAILSELDVRFLSWLVVSNLSAELRLVRDNRLSVVVGMVWVVIGVVARGVFDRVVVDGGEVRSNAVGFWSRPLHTCKDIKWNYKKNITYINFFWNFESQKF